MLTRQDFIPGRHTRTSKGNHDRHRRVFQRIWQELRASQKNFQTSTSNTEHPEHLQNLHTRASDSISLGSPRDLLSRNCKRSCKDRLQIFHQDLYKIFSKGPVLNHARTSDVISLGSPQNLLQGPVQDHARTSQRGSPQNLHKILSTGPVQDKAGGCTRSSRTSTSLLS